MHQCTHIESKLLAHFAANNTTQRKLGGVEVAQPPHYLLEIPKDVMRWLWARLVGQSGPAGLAREGLYARHGCLVRSISYLSPLVCWSVWSVTNFSLSSAWLVVWHWSSSIRLKYSHKYHTDMYRPLSEWSIPIIDWDTDPYRFRLPTKFTDMPTLVSAGPNTNGSRGSSQLRPTRSAAGCRHWRQLTRHSVWFQIELFGADAGSGHLRGQSAAGRTMPRQVRCRGRG